MSDKAININTPTHEILDDNEVKEVLSRMQLKPENLPKLLSTDPQALRAGAKPGSIILVKRSDYGHDYLYYRFVVEG